jgi:hypothetical protein
MKIETDSFYPIKEIDISINAGRFRFFGLIIEAAPGKFH